VRAMIDSICAVMLNKPLPQGPAEIKSGAASRRDQTVGGYAEFARVNSNTERPQP
jgi:hypothetical protein